MGPVSGLEVPRYAGHSTFARLPRIEDVDDYDIAVVGVPFDSGVSYRPGARFGPAHIRQGSRLLRPYNPSLDTMPFAEAQVVDAGDVTANPFDIGQAVEQIDAAMTELSANGKKLVILGGDHTISLPVLRALKRQYGPIALVHFDAHLDTWDSYFDAPLTHGTPFRRAWEEKLLDADHVLHVGIRGSLYSRQDLVDDREMGFTTIAARDLDRMGLQQVIDLARERVGERPVYLSIDIDVLDPGFAPGTGTPEAGGLTSRELLEIVRGFDGANIVAGDIVEVAPAYDHAEITAIAAANLAYEYCSLMARAIGASRPADSAGPPDSGSPAE